MDSVDHKHLIDFTLGDALLSFDEVAYYAFECAKFDQNKYICNKPEYLSMSYPLMEVFDKISPWLAHRKFINNTPQAKDNVKNRSILTGGGASEAFEYVLRLIHNNFLNHNIERKKNGHDALKPVILMPVPTYGFFMNMIQRRDIYIAPIKRDVENGGKLDINKLKAGIEKLERNGFRIIAYFDSNPNNPTGLVRDEKETREIANVIQHINKRYKKQDIEQGCDWNGPAAQVSIIDDLVYTSTEYQGQKPAFSFLQIPECRRNSFLIMGLSKVGLAGLRVGYLLSPLTFAKALRLLQQDMCYFASRPAIYGFEAYLNMEEPFASQKRAYTQKLTAAHERSGHLMKALVNGMDNMPELSEDYKKELIETIQKLKNIEKDEAQKYLNMPLTDARIVTTPQSGFFHLLSMKKIQGKKRLKLEDDNQYSHVTSHHSKNMNDLTDSEGNEDSEANDLSNKYDVINNEIDVKNHIAMTQNVFLLASKWMGYGDGNEMIFRMSYAIPDTDIIEGVERIRDFVSTFE